MQTKRGWLFFLCLVLLAASVRFLGITQFPPLLTQDEASLAYNAWSIVQTGRDEWGRSFPLVFQAFGDAKQPVYVYLTSLWFGLTGWRLGEVRLISAVAGTLAVGLATWWVWLKTRRQEWALLAGVITALVPWTVHLSRMALESNVALMFFLLGLVTWEQAHAKKTPKRWQKIFWVITALSWAVASYTYIAYRLFLVLWLGILALQRRHGWRIVVTLTTVLMIPGFMLGGSNARLSQIGIFRPEVIEAPMISLRNNCHLVSAELSQPLVRYACAGLWNEYTMPLLLVVRSWLLHLSPDFLFFSGDSEVYRNPLQTGAFYVFLLPLYVLGLVEAAKKWRQHGWLLLAWGLSVLPSVLTAEPQAFRLTPHYPFVLMLIILGGLTLSTWLPKRWREWVAPATAGATLLFFLSAAPLYIANSFGASETWLAHGEGIGTTLETFRQQDTRVYIHNVIPEVHIFWAYWNQISPQEYQQLNLAESTDALGFQRPTQIGPGILIGERAVKEVICGEPSVGSPDAVTTGEDTSAANIPDVAIISLEPALNSFQPTQQIRSQNQVHVMANVYYLPQLLETQPEKVREYCSQ